MTPKIYLVKRRTTPEEQDLIRAALSLTPLQALVAADARDTQTALELSDRVETLHRPIGILADFDGLLTAINEDGSLCRVI